MASDSLEQKSFHPSIDARLFSRKEVLSTSLEKTFLVVRWPKTRIWTGDFRHKDNPGFYLCHFSISSD